MARRKFRGNQRHEPVTERSFLEYLSTPALQTSRSELMRLVRGGEDTFLELKVKLSNPEKIAQGIVALANTGGGLIVFGVNDNMRVEGVDDAEDDQAAARVGEGDDSLRNFFRIGELDLEFEEGVFAAAHQPHQFVAGGLRRGGGENVLLVGAFGGGFVPPVTKFSASHLCLDGACF